MFIDRIIVVKTQHLWVEDNSLFFIFLRHRTEIMKFAPVDKEKTFLMYFKRFHIDKCFVFSGFQVENFNFLVPVMLHLKACEITGRKIIGTGENTGAVCTDFP